MKPRDKSRLRLLICDTVYHICQLESHTTSQYTRSHDMITVQQLVNGIYKQNHILFDKTISMVKEEYLKTKSLCHVKCLYNIIFKDGVYNIGRVLTIIALAAYISKYLLAHGIYIVDPIIELTYRAIAPFDERQLLYQEILSFKENRYNQFIDIPFILCGIGTAVICFKLWSIYCC